VGTLRRIRNWGHAESERSFSDEKTKDEGKEKGEGEIGTLKRKTINISLPKGG